jgi:hypothetical protein
MSKKPKLLSFQQRRPSIFEDVPLPNDSSPTTPDLSFSLAFGKWEKTKRYKAVQGACGVIMDKQTEAAATARRPRRYYAEMQED